MKRGKAIPLVWLALWVALASTVSLRADSDQAQEGGNRETDPFADLSAPPPAPETPPRSSWQTFFGENFAFRKELMSQFSAGSRNQGASDGASRQSVGFEVQKKFSSATATLASFNFQGRMVRRDGFLPVWNELEGQNRPDWFFEYHNFYLDLYNALNPVLGQAGRGQHVGRFNIRAGRFYVPFGINLQTDTHGTVLQLSNEQNFGFERDWYAGFWGRLNRHFNYDAYYVVGSGYDLKFKGQKGLAALRLSLSNQYSYEHGLEGGFSLLGGERLVSGGMARNDNGMSEAGNSLLRVETKRAGFDGRYRRAVPRGSLTLTSEVSGGSDARNAVSLQLHQAEYLRSSRHWGVAAQYRRFWRDAVGTDASLIGEVSWYFRNDVGNSNLHWIKLNIERPTERAGIRPGLIVALQYYYYW